MDSKAPEPECDNLNTNQIPTNEEVIGDLISDFQNLSKSGNDVDKNDLENLDVGEDDTPEKEKSEDDDFIDDLLLKDAEVNYTEEESKEKRIEASKFKDIGNQLFKDTDYVTAAMNYTLALRTCPLLYSEDRAILFANRGACKMKREVNDAAIEDCSKAVELNPSYVKAYLRRAALYEKTEKLDEALEDYKKIVELCPNNNEAKHACMRLPQQINERNEKLKTEMLGTLKDLGNKILRPFGLSTENFQVTQDPNSGGYSINFQQNK